MQNNNKKLIAGLVIAVLLCFGLTIALVRANIGRSKAEDNLSIEIQTPEKVATKDGRKVQQVPTADGTSSQIRRATDSAFALKDKEIKKINEAHRLAIVEMEARLKQPIIVRYVVGDTTVADSSREFCYDTDSIKMHGFVQKDAMIVDSLYLPNMIYERDVVLKRGFLGFGREKVTQYYNTNSLWNVNGAAVLTVTKKPNAWNRWIKPTLFAGAGAALTYYIIK